MENKADTSMFSRACRPSGFRNLDQDQIEILHNASLEIMERTGMRFFDQEALDLFKKAGAGISDENLVRIPSHLVDWARKSVPENVNIYDRNRQLCMMLGGDRTYYSVGSDCMSTYDLETGEHRTAVLSDVVNGVRLVDALYDRRVKLLMSAEAPPAELYRGIQLAFPFQRTVSRLEEMRSHQYLEEAHRP